jgi:hypothetical protein
MRPGVAGDIRLLLLTLAAPKSPARGQWNSQRSDGVEVGGEEPQRLRVTREGRTSRCWEISAPPGGEERRDSSELTADISPINCSSGNLLRRTKLDRTSFLHRSERKAYIRHSWEHWARLHHSRLDTPPGHRHNLGPGMAMGSSWAPVDSSYSCDTSAGGLRSRR